MVWFWELLYVKNMLSRHWGPLHFRKSSYLKLSVLEARHGGKDHSSEVNFVGSKARPHFLFYLAATCGQLISACHCHGKTQSLQLLPTTSEANSCPHLISWTLGHVGWLVQIYSGVYAVGSAFLGATETAELSGTQLRFHGDRFCVPAATVVFVRSLSVLCVSHRVCEPYQDRWCSGWGDNVTLTPYKQPVACQTLWTLQEAPWC